MLQTEAQPSVITYWLLKLMLLCDVSATSYQDYYSLKGKPHHPIKIAIMNDDGGDDDNGNPNVWGAVW